MAKKLGPPIFLGVFTVLAIVLLTGGGSGDRNNDKEVLSQTFHIDAIYDDTKKHVQISFSDKSDKTTKVVMEILGMDKSFQKTYFDSEFVELVAFPHIPKYGWATHPVVLEIDHDEFGHIQIKTEIYPMGELVPQVIYSTP